MASARFGRAGEPIEDPGQIETSVRIGILALQGDVREHAASLERLGCKPVLVRRQQELEAVDALILPGGESTTLSMLLESSGLLQPLRGRLSSGMPAFGTCAGLILLARDVVDGRSDQQQLDAIDIVARRNAFGRQAQSFECDLVVAGLSGPELHAVFIRAPVIESIGPDVEALASVVFGDGRERVVLCRSGAVLVAAFHPELVGDDRLHALFLEMVVEHRKPDKR